MTDLISSLADSIVALINAAPRSPTKAEIDAILRGAIPVFTNNGNIINIGDYEVHNPHVVVYLPWLAALCKKAGVAFPSEIQGALDGHVERERKARALLAMADCQGEAAFTNKLEDCTDLSEASLAAAVAEIRWVNDPALLAGQPKVPANYQLPSATQAMRAARDAIRKSSYEPGLGQATLNAWDAAEQAARDKAKRTIDEAAYRQQFAESAEALKEGTSQFAEKIERRAVEIFNALPEGSVCCPGSSDGAHRWYPATSRTPNGTWRCACGARKP